ncbi:serine/threonine-protein phosphatase 6 regulatory ankyrin repeat subunit C-like [Mobula birostris]|uniref:serine/threonine-protein phosphatase 6 regulatory ankyrin repeat subunit C-like n=1 Tax=Mobula birostris TaxID=1983395 RepID=UPI003B28C5E8
MEYLLDHGADPSIPDKQGYSAIHYAASHGSKQGLELIMETAMDCLNEGEGDFFVSPLHLAAYSGHHVALGVLVEVLGTPDVRDCDGRTPLYVAAKRGHTDCVEILTQHGASILIPERLTKGTPLHAAAASGHTDCLHVLIDSTEDTDVLDTMDAHGQTAVMLAVTNSHGECIHLLLEKGASTDTADKRGRTALHRGAVQGCEEAVAALLDHQAFALCRDVRGRTPLHLAAASGHSTILEALLQAAFSTDPLDSLRDYSGYTPLHWACYKGHEDCLEVLLEHEMLSNLGGEPFTVLHCAVINGHDRTAEMLIDVLGAKIVNSQDAKGRTPLHAAAFSNRLHCLLLLLSHGAQVNAVDQAGRTPLMFAAQNGHCKIVEILLQRAGADLTLHDVNKNTALHLACSKGHEMCALLILGQICDTGLINATNSTLQMPLHIAARNGMSSVVQALLNRGATVLAVDGEGHTPALACAPNKDVADCLALILATMKPFPSKDSVSSLGLNLLKNCGILAKAVSCDQVSGFGASPLGLDSCYPE